MKESDYILATNLARVSAVRELLAHITTINDDIPAVQLGQVRRLAAEWEQKMFQRLNGDGKSAP